MEIKPKPPCSFGSKCYRKNPQHFRSYSHPKDAEKNQTESKTPENSSPSKKLKLESSNLKPKRNSPRKCQSRMKQTALQFRRADKVKSPKVVESNEKKGENKKCKEESFKKDSTSEDDSDHKTHSSKSGWIFISNSEAKTEIKSMENELKGKSDKEIIKHMFLFDMPECFYSFFDFCKSINKEKPEKALECTDLKLVGPFDVLLGKMNLCLDKDSTLCHWRYYYDPPEFQTILATNSGFHIGYWRDDPNDLPVLLASNNPEKDCVFKAEGENIFGAVYHYLGNLIKTSDPFAKMKITKLQSVLTEWADKSKFSLEKSTTRMNMRQKKVVSKCFHKLGIVVPVEKKTELGYRPLIETEGNLKKICQHIIDADTESERESLWENLQPLINAANIANDECDFGNSLELGIDLFCMGSSLFHETIIHLLSTAYSLLNRNQFEEIIKAHLKNRRKGHTLSSN